MCVCTFQMPVVTSLGTLVSMANNYYKKFFYVNTENKNNQCCLKEEVIRTSCNSDKNTCISLQNKNVKTNNQNQKPTMCILFQILYTKIGISYLNRPYIRDINYQVSQPIWFSFNILLISILVVLNKVLWQSNVNSARR